VRSASNNSTAVYLQFNDRLQDVSERAVLTTPYRKKRIMTDKKLCRFCHTTVQYQGMFCINCGAPLEEPPYGDNEAHRPSALQTEEVLDEIRRLEKLRDQGGITEREFQEQRRNLIGTLTANQSKKKI